MSKEEKAKEYAKDCALCPTLDGQDEIDKAHQEEIERAYIHAYTQSEQDLSSQLTAYKEALRELVEHIECIEANVNHSEGFFNAMMNATEYLTKAKTLIE